MDDFPVIVPEDDGFAIYLNDERVDWYNNEADAEGVALSMVDKELNDESFFDRPLEESVSNDSDLKDEIVKLINATNDFKVKVEGQYVRILYNNTEVADFSLEEGITHNYAPKSLNPSSRGDGKNTFRVLDVGGKGWSDLSFMDFYDNEELLSKYLDTLGELCRYYTLKTLYDNEFLYDHPVPEEANSWHCAQWGTWKFIINSLNDVKTCIAALEDGFDMAQERYSALYESANLKESSPESPNGCSPLYTGLAYKEVYSNIISSFVGQIYDGIGENDGREGRIFNYYYRELDYVRSGCINGELVIYAEPYALEQLIRGIWRTAQIERNDEGATDKNMYYDYLDANWSDICKLQGTLNSIAKRWSQDPSNFKNEPWSDEKKAANDARIAKAKADAEAKIAAEKKAKEEAEAKKAAEIDTKINTIIPDAKDIQRARSAWSRSNDSVSKLYWNLKSQLNRIEDVDKAKRRIIAFYNEALKHPESDNFNSAITWFKDLIDRDIDL